MNKKRFGAAILLVLTVVMMLLSFTSCKGVEDIGFPKGTKANLDFNGYETTLYDKKNMDDLDDAAAAYCSNILVGTKDDEKIFVFYCKTEGKAQEVLTYLGTLKDSEPDKYKGFDFEGFKVVDEEQDVEISAVYFGTNAALKAAIKRSWFSQLRHTFIEGESYKYMLKGFGNTIIITLGALLIGVILGIIIAVAKYYSEGNPKLRVVNFICDLYTTVIRGIPITVLLLIFFFIVLVKADGIIVAIIAFGINSGAYMAELVRSGINAVDAGQMEAARSLGLSKWQAMRSVIFPQAVKNILPAIGNECIALLKETSVAGYVAVVDLTRGANLIRNNTYDAFNPLILSALIYLTLVVIMTKLLSILERRLAKSERRINK